MSFGVVKSTTNTATTAENLAQHNPAQDTMSELSTDSLTVRIQTAKDIVNDPFWALSKGITFNPTKLTTQEEDGSCFVYSDDGIKSLCITGDSPNYQVEFSEKKLESGGNYIHQSDKQKFLFQRESGTDGFTVIALTGEEPAASIQQISSPLMKNSCQSTLENNMRAEGTTDQYSVIQKTTVSDAALRERKPKIIETESRKVSNQIEPKQKNIVPSLKKDGDWINLEFSGQKKIIVAGQNYTITKIRFLAHSFFDRPKVKAAIISSFTPDLVTDVVKIPHSRRYNSLYNGTICGHELKLDLLNNNRQQLNAIVGHIENETISFKLLTANANSRSNFQDDG